MADIGHQLKRKFSFFVSPMSPSQISFVGVKTPRSNFSCLSPFNSPYIILAHNSPADMTGEAFEMEDSFPGLPHQVQRWDTQPATATFRTKPPETYYCSLRFPIRNRHTLDKTACNILVWDSQAATATFSLLFTTRNHHILDFYMTFLFFLKKFFYKPQVNFSMLTCAMCFVHVLHSTYKGVCVNVCHLNVGKKEGGGSI